MRNIFLFIKRYFNFLFFLLLQILALTFLFRYNKFHQAAFSNIAGELTGRIDEKYNNVEYYFKLKKTNEALAKENIYLRGLLKSNYQIPDTARMIVTDSIRVDSLLKYQKYIYYLGSVVGSFTSTQVNYLTVHRGRLQGVHVDMGVVGPSGIVGRVVSVSDNFSVVMSALHKDFTVKAKLKKSGENGPIRWDGIDQRFIQMKDVPKSAVITKGDTVLTSELSSIYPPNIMVGTVESIFNDKSSNFYTIKLKTATNFFNVQYVYIIDDAQKPERAKLESDIYK